MVRVLRDKPCDFIPKQRRTWREIFHSFLYYPNACHSCRCTRLQWGARYSSQDSPPRWTGLRHWSQHLLPSGLCIGRKLDWGARVSTPSQLWDMGLTTTRPTGALSLSGDRNVLFSPSPPACFTQWQYLPSSNQTMHHHKTFPFTKFSNFKKYTGTNADHAPIHLREIWWMGGGEGLIN